MSTQLELSIWNTAIDNKQVLIKKDKERRKNEWIERNLKQFKHSEFKHDEFDKPNLNGMR